MQKSRRVIVVSATVIGLAASWMYAKDYFEGQWVVPACLALCLTCVAYSFSALREAAIYALLIGITPSVVVLFLFGDMVSVSMAYVLLSVIAAHIYFVDGQYRAMIDRLLLDKRIHEQANSDVLTQLANRRYFIEWMKNSLNTVYREPLAIILLDLDGFKQVNDEHGYPVGDAMLKTIAERLNSFCNKGEFSARLGGDEFVVVMLADQNLQSGFQQRCEALLALLGQPLNIDNIPIQPRASIGYAVYP